MPEPTTLSWRKAVTSDVGDEIWPGYKAHTSSRLEDQCFSRLNGISQHLYKAGDYRIQSKMCDTSNNKGATVTKEGQGERMYERKKKKHHRKWERRDRQAGTWRQTPQEKKHNNKWPTSCSKVGKVSMTPSLRKNVEKNIYCPSVPRVSSGSGRISQQPLRTNRLRFKQDR